MFAWLEEYAPRIVEQYDEAGLLALRNEFVAAKPGLAHHISLMRILTMREAAQRVGYSAEVGEQAFQVMWEERNRVDLFSDVKPVLSQLRSNGLILGALSNGNADIDQVGLGEYFDFSLNAISGGEPKPAVRMFQRAAALAGCKPGEVMHVGDDLVNDVEGANAAGMVSVWLNRSRQSDSQKVADYEIESLEQLPDLIDRLA